MFLGPNKIRILDELTANKIAAGEVVERPASIVKELVENAVDAGSTRIEIAIEDGGLRKIRVSDNGWGIAKEDAVLAFQRHATSKIKDAEDLSRIGSLGFRGEALPSIAAVAQVTLTTKTPEELSGTSLVIRGGKVEQEAETGSPLGTTVVVEHLFFNTPARRKFLKSPVAETGQISDLVLRLALARPDIAFKLFSNGKETLGTPGSGSLGDAVAALYGLEIARQMIPFEAETLLFKVAGFLGKPHISRYNRNHQTFFVNNRYIKSRLLSQALEEGYHTFLTSGRHPAAILNFEVDPAWVDVNVHPTKMEVRFSKEKEFILLLVEEVGKSLRGLELIPGLEKERSFRETAAAQWGDHAEQAVLPLPEYQGYNSRQREPWGLVEEAEVQPPESKGPVKETLPFTHKELRREELLPPLIPLGQIDLTYIVAQGPEGLFIIDQHAAHERVLYEKYMIKAGSDLNYSQELLMPLRLHLTHSEALVLVKHILVLTDLGFEIEHFGGDTFLIRSFPQGLAKGREMIFLQDLLAQLEDVPINLTASRLKERIVITMACKGAIKAGQRLSPQEMEALIDSLTETENPYTCPHGRPTILHYSSYDLERKFKRKL